MRAYVESILLCDADLAWNEVQKSTLLAEVVSPIAAISALHGEILPERWSALSTLRCRTHLFGVIPLGTRTLYFERIDAERREIQSREHDALIQRWDHLVRIEPLGPGQCRYSDEIEIEAGPLTLAVWLFACAFYRHRQRRWQTVAKRLQSRDRQTRALVSDLVADGTISLAALTFELRQQAHLAI